MDVPTKGQLEVLRRYGENGTHARDGLTTVEFPCRAHAARARVGTGGAEWVSDRSGGSKDWEGEHGGDGNDGAGEHLGGLRGLLSA